jgi:hypothetical protein
MTSERIVKEILRYEAGKMASEEIPDFFQLLVDSRVLFKLKKEYANRALVLHLDGLINLAA